MRPIKGLSSGNTMQVNPTTERLIKSAWEALESAYSPYSGFRVGAAVLGVTGRIYTGCNIENSSYGLSICAERTAIFKGISDGEKSFDELAVAADTPGPIIPCGACCQVLAEFNPDIKVIMINKSGISLAKNLKELFPMPFKLTDNRSS